MSSHYPAYMREWRANHPGVMNEYARNRVRRWREGVAKYKVEQGCVDCGYNTHGAALDFDHLPEMEKCFPVSKGHRYTLERQQAEIAKCEIVCANCHRIRTYERGRV